jgi:DNA uptake protein ComE-like DNA-binding protein
MPIDLRFAGSAAENNAVQANKLSSALVVAILYVFLAGQSATAAEQYWPEAKAHEVIPPDERIDINHASLTKLLKVPGMTRTWANRIVRFRPYHTKLDLREKGVVSDQVYERIKDYVIAHRNSM